jgi:hypothetical protein
MRASTQAARLPTARSGTPALIDEMKLVGIDRGPQAIGWTHPKEVNEAMLNFLPE